MIPAIAEVIVLCITREATFTVLDMLLNLADIGWIGYVNRLQILRLLKKKQ